MAFKQTSNWRLSLSRLTRERDHVNGASLQLKRQIRDTSLKVKTRPALRHKIRKFMDQLFAFRREEEGLIHKIESIEQKHSFLRKKKLLRNTAISKRRYEAEKAHQQELKRQSERERHKREKKLLWILLFLLFLMMKSGNRPSFGELKPAPR